FGTVAALRPHWDELINACSNLPRPEAAFRDSLFAATLDHMVADGNLIFVNDRQRARSRFFEMIHYMRHLRQRTHKYPQPEQTPELVEMIKAEVVERERPLRQVTHDALLSEIVTISECLTEIESPSWANDVNLIEAAEWARGVFENFLVRAFKE